MEQCKLTRDGVRIYSYPNPSLHGFYLSLYVRAGSIYEEEKSSGITHFLEHVAIRNVNAQTGGRLYADLDRYGLEFNASTYNEMIQFYISGAIEHFERAAERIARLLSPLVLSKAEVDLERRRIKAEIRESDDKGSLLSFTQNLLYPTSPLRFSIVGTNSSVERITRARLEEYRREIFSADNMFFYLTGNVTDAHVEALKSILDAYEIPTKSARTPTVTIPAEFGHRGGEVYVKNADFTMLRFHFDLDLRRVSAPESDLLYDILFAGYNSRFFLEMSERRGLFYDVSGSVERYGEIGSFDFSFEVKRSDIEEAVCISVELLREMKTTLLPDDALMRAAYVDNAYLLYDDARELNFTFAYDAHILGAPYRDLEDRRAAYRAVTPERLREVAREIFTLRNCVLTMKSDKKKTDTERIRAILKRIDE